MFWAGSFLSDPPDEAVGLEIASTAIGDGCERCQGVPQPAFLDLGAISSL